MRLLFYILDRIIDAVGERFRLLRRGIDLFLGFALLLVGAFSFESNRYCDGNPADYLSCTRPSTYYYYDVLDITLIVFGVFFILFWIIRRMERAVVE